MFRRSKVRTLLAAGAAIGMLVTGSGVASAATDATFPNSGYGFDGNANLAVGGGSTTLYLMMQNLAKLYMDTSGCTTNNATYNAAASGATTYPQTSPAFNQCDPTTQSYSGINAGGDYDGDTIAIAAPVGSSTGIASLNGSHSGNSATYAYEGANSNIETGTGADPVTDVTNGYGTVDFATSSRAAKTSGGNCPDANPTTDAAGDELQCDTFWGIASDGVDVFTFDNSSGAYDSDATNSAGTGGFSAQDLYDIYTCDVKATGTLGANEWGDLPEWQAVSKAYAAKNGGAADPDLPAADAPIVPYSMNSNSGTLGDFENYIDANVTAADDSFNPDNYSCARELSGGVIPLENDVKPLIEDAENNSFTPPAYPASGAASPYATGTTFPAGVSTSATSPQNPINWLWFGSYGLLTEFPYLSGGTVDGVTFSSAPLPIASPADTTSGLTPSATDIGNDTYPIERILSVVTLKADADCPVTDGKCNFSATPGPTNGNGDADLNVLGATGGVGGAVREFVRFLCRPSASLEPTDPYTGVNTFTEIKGAIADSGFEAIPSGLASPGSSCDVQSVG